MILCALRAPVGVVDWHTGKDVGSVIAVTGYVAGRAQWSHGTSDTDAYHVMAGFINQHASCAGSVFMTPLENVTWANCPGCAGVLQVVRLHDMPLIAPEKTDVPSDLPSDDASTDPSEGRS